MVAQSVILYVFYSQCETLGPGSTLPTWCGVLSTLAVADLE